MDFNGYDLTTFRYVAIICRGCGSRMRLASICPLLRRPGVDEITYRCEPCNREATRQLLS
jgi:hypothetical protein